MKVMLGIGLGLLAVGCLGLFGCDATTDNSNGATGVTNAVGATLLFSTTEAWGATETKATSVDSPAVGFVTATLVSHGGSTMSLTLTRSGAVVGGPTAGSSVTLRTAASNGEAIGISTYNPNGASVTCTLTMTYTPD